MIKRKAVAKSDQVKVTFVLPGDDSRLPASVLGTFNGWNAEAHPLKARSNKTYSATVTVDKDARFLFRYRSADGKWFNDDDADDYERNPAGDLNCVLIT
jgi:hypothetical protein